MLQPLRSSSMVSPHLSYFNTKSVQKALSPTRVCVAESSELLSLLAERVEERKTQLQTLEQVKEQKRRRLVSDLCRVFP